MNEYVEIRNGGYYISGTRIGLDAVVHAFHDGESAEAILDSYSLIGSLAKVYGAIAFILDHPLEVDAYLKTQNRLFEEFKTSHPLAPSMVDGFEQAKAQTLVKVD